MKQIIIGPTFFAAGRALREGSDILVIGHNSSIGDEWCYSYRQISSTGYIPNSPLTADLQKELRDLALDSAEQNALALSVILYGVLEKYSGKFKLWTEIESIKETDNGYELTVFTVSGRETLNCEELIDNYPEAHSCPDWGKSNIRSKRLNMLVHNCGTEILEPFPAFDRLAVRNGRNDRELVVEHAVNPEVTMEAARRQLLEIWSRRPESIRPWKIGTFGAEFDYDMNCDRQEVKSKWKYLNPLSFSSPIAAFDAGLTGGDL